MLQNANNASAPLVCHTQDMRPVRHSGGGWSQAFTGCFNPSVQVSMPLQDVLSTFLMLRNEGSCEILELGLSDKTPPHEQPSVAHVVALCFSCCWRWLRRTVLSTIAHVWPTLRSKCRMVPHCQEGAWLKFGSANPAAANPVRQAAAGM